MGLFGEFEQRLERTVEGFFAKVFRSGVHPVEVGKRLLRVMEDGKTLGVKRTYVPNVYRVTLSEKDYERLSSIEARLVEDFEVFVTEVAQQRGWTLPASPRVSFASAPRLSPGEFRVDAESVAVPSRTAASAREHREAGTLDKPLAPGLRQSLDAGQACLVVMEGQQKAETIPLLGTLRIGRQPDNDLELNDPNVSRHHARVFVRDGDYVLQDLGSLNHTTVNGSRIREHRLDDGDRIVLGQTVIEFRRS